MFTLGETVEVLQDSDQRWYPAMVLEVSADGYKALWLYSDKAFFVEAAKVRALSPWRVGASVQGMREDNRWYDAKVAAANEDGTFDLAYTDGQTGSHVATERIHGERLVKRKRSGEGGDAKRPSSSTASSSSKGGDKPCNEGPGWTRCKDWGCQKLSTSNQHCGACGHGCRGDQTCNDGVCGCHSYEHLDENGRCSS